MIMKITCSQDRSAAIAAGIEPAANGKIEVEINLSDLTPAQRKVLVDIDARGASITVIAGTAEEVVARLQECLDVQAAIAARERADYAKFQSDCDEWCRTAVVTPASGQMQMGISYATFDFPSLPTHRYAYPQFVLDRRAALELERIEKNANALAAVQPQIDAAAARAARAAADAEALAKQIRHETHTKRLETGIVEVELSRGSRSEWGEPWIATVSTRNGRKPEYDFTGGRYDAATETLSIPCKPGDTIAWGQKNYRKPRKTIHNVRTMREDGSLAE